MLRGLSLVLVRTRFPENVGMTARAMANMGADNLVLVNPERWDKQKALPLATPQAEALLDSISLVPSLSEALSSCVAAYGATARAGGWRKELISPEKAARELRAVVRQGGRAALVFGSEDRGLENEDVELCTRLVHIPTAIGSSSLNLAQAALILLYECAKADRELPFAPDAEAGRAWTRSSSREDSRRATLEEEALLMAKLQELLLRIDFLSGDNPSWFMRPMRRFLRKGRLRRHEFDMLMGVCRQMENALARGGREK